MADCGQQTYALRSHGRIINALLKVSERVNIIIMLLDTLVCDTVLYGEGRLL